MDTPVHLSQLAARQFARRQQEARRQVGLGKIEPRAAEAGLRPWLAIACLCGADLPELIEPLADRIMMDISGAPILSESQARALLAMDICPARQWAPLLARARDRAIHHAASFGDPTERWTAIDRDAREAALTDARALRQIAEALDVHIPFNPAIPERKAA